MASKKESKEVKVDYEEPNFIVDDTEPLKEVPVQKQSVENIEVQNKPVEKKPIDGEPLINCLRNERVIVRYIPKQSGIITDPKNPFYGGMGENCFREFGVPRLRSGLFVDVLTKEEMRYLEHVMQLEPGALSIYRRQDNFWDNSNINGISKVRLKKQDNYLNLWDPQDYIRYKILLARKQEIAPSLKAYQDSPKVTYQFVIINENDEANANKTRVSAKKQCYKEWGKIDNDPDTLRVIIEMMEGRKIASNVKLDVLNNKVMELIESNSKMFLDIVQDKMLPTKVLIKKCIEAGLISNRGDWLYLANTDTPLCESNQNPTLSVASEFLNQPKNNELKMMLMAKLKQ